MMSLKAKKDSLLTQIQAQIQTQIQTQIQAQPRPKTSSALIAAKFQRLASIYPRRTRHGKSEIRSLFNRRSNS